MHESKSFTSWSLKHALNKVPGELDSSFFFRTNLERSRLLTVRGILHRSVVRIKVHGRACERVIRMPPDELECAARQ